MSRREGWTRRILLLKQKSKRRITSRRIWREILQNQWKLKPSPIQWVELSKRQGEPMKLRTQSMIFLAVTLNTRLCTSRKMQRRPRRKQARKQKSLSPALKKHLSARSRQNLLTNLLFDQGEEAMSSLIQRDWKGCRSWQRKPRRRKTISENQSTRRVFSLVSNLLAMSRKDGKVEDLCGERSWPQN